MTRGGRGEKKKAEQAERYARYTALRDGGMYPCDAWREVGIQDWTGHAYERAYREAHGLPRRRMGGGTSWR